MRKFVSGQVVVTDAVTPVTVLPQDTGQALVRNTGEVTVFVGGPDVTAAHGFPILPSDAPVPIPVFDADIAYLFAVVAGPDKDDDDVESGSLAFLVSI